MDENDRLKSRGVNNGSVEDELEGNIIVRPSILTNYILPHS